MKINSKRWLATFSQAIVLSNTEKDRFMPYDRYKGLDGKLKTFNPDEGVVWRRSIFCGADRPEDYQGNFVYEVRHLPELPSGFILRRSFDLAEELYLQASEAANKRYTSRKFVLLEVERAQLFIQGMECEPILELKDLRSPMPQGAQMPPVSDPQSEGDVMPDVKPQEPEAADFEIISGTEINTKVKAVRHIFFKLLVSGEIRSIPPERLTNHMAEQAMLRFPRFSKITSSDVNYALKDLDVYKPYHRQKSKSVKAFSASGEKTKHMLEGSQSVDEDSQEAVDARIDIEAEIESLIRSQRECGKHGN